MSEKYLEVSGLATQSGIIWDGMSREGTIDDLVRLMLADLLNVTSITSGGCVRFSGLA